MQGVRLLPLLCGFWHAAGVLADALVANQDTARLQRAHGPKAYAAGNLQRAGGTLPLRVCTMFASPASLVGSAGQANYSAANGCLDAVAMTRRRQAQPGVSVQWGPWAEVGMAASTGVNERMKAGGEFGHDLSRGHNLSSSLADLKAKHEKMH